MKKYKFIFMYLTVTIIVLHLSLYLSSYTTAAKTKEQSLTEKQKEQDLNMLCKSLEKKHKNLFAVVSKKDFYKQKQKIVDKISELTDTEFYFELKNLVAMVKDAHTRIRIKDSNFSINTIPIKIEKFSDGYYITSIDSKNKQYLGYQLISINGNKLSDIYNTLSNYISYENKAWLNVQFQNEIINADLLKYLGIIEDISNIPCVVHNGKDKVKINLASYKEKLPKMKAIEIKQNKTFYKEDSIYHFEELENKTFYIQYNSCQEDKNFPIADFADQIEKELEEKNYKKVIVDLRYNTGGNSIIFEPVITKIMQAKQKYKFNLYTLISNTTFSSGLINSINFIDIGAVLVGEPTGGNVVSYGDIKTFLLPNSLLEVTYSTKYFELIQNYEKDSLYPDVEIKADFSDYKNGIDSCVKAILENSNGIKGAVSRIKRYTLSEKRRDLEFLCSYLEENHANLFHSVSKEEFYLQKEKILEKIDSLNEIEFFLELMRLCSMVKDNATEIYPNNDQIWNKVSYFPFEIEKFEDGWYLTAIEKQYKKYLGYKLTKIDNLKIEDIYQKISSILDSENKYASEEKFSGIIYSANFLKYFDIIDNISRIKLTIEKGGEEAEIVLESVRVNTLYRNLSYNNIEKPRNEMYRFIDLKDKTFLIEYNACVEIPDYPIEKFAQEIEKQIEKEDYEKVIVDFRYNNGEYSSIFEPVILKLSKLKEKKNFSLYALIGKATSSQVLKNVLDLKEIGAVTVGSPTIENINYYGQTKNYIVPSTKFFFSYPTRHFIFSKEDPTDAFYPDIEVKRVFEDYKAGKDLEMEFIKMNFPSVSE